jgi:phage portal protein BeeE
MGGGISRAAPGASHESLQRKALKLPPVYTAANGIAKILSSYIPGIYERAKPEDKPTPVENHPFELLLHDPNSFMSGVFFRWFIGLCLPIRGSAFIFVGLDDNLEPESLWPLPPMSVQPIPGPDTKTPVLGYEFSGRDGRPYLIPHTQVIWCRMPNILDPLDGMSGVSALESTIKTELGQRRFRENFFGPRNASPTTIFNIKKPVTRSQFFAIRDEIIKELRVVDRAALVMRAGDMDVKAMEMNLDDLAIVQLSDSNRREFMEVLGWSEALGAQNTTYASMYASLDMVTEWHVYPIAQLLAGDITTQFIRPTYGEQFICQYEDFRPARRDEDRQDYTTYAPDMTVNEARAKQGLDPIEAGPVAEYCDTLPTRFIPLIPELASMGQQGEEQTQEEPPAEEENKALDELGKWERKALRFAQSGRHPSSAPFVCHDIPAWLKSLTEAALTALPDGVSDQGVLEVFAGLREIAATPVDLPITEVKDATAEALLLARYNESEPEEVVEFMPVPDRDTLFANDTLTITQTDAERAVAGAARVSDEWAQLMNAPTWDENVKGGPGSGNWGHAGRPGKRGGSAPGSMRGSGRVNPRYFEVGPGRKLVEGLDEKTRKVVVDMMVRDEIQPRHLEGLKRITTEPTKIRAQLSPDNPWRSHVGDYDAAGVYDPQEQSIHINPDFISSSRYIFSHELGHHVTMRSAFLESKRGQRANDLLVNGFKDMKDAYRYGFVDRVTKGDLARYGLREYSLTKDLEFKADTFRVYHYGSNEQRQALAEYLEVDSLDEIFGGSD